MYCIVLCEKYVPEKKEVIKKFSRAWVGLVQQKCQRLAWDKKSKKAWMGSGLQFC